ncbi:MAG: type II toxin-antitoxin system VapC family toxin [Bacteroidetes bacterium]|nr:type II toxin-antitoxin system VapC family toxin [Bacteroidota bacterium]
MAKNLVIVDSCVFIKAFRKDKKAIQDLNSIAERTAYSVITLLELLTGANTKTKKETIFKIFDSLYSIPLNPSISDKATDIMNRYISGQQHISVPDCLIAATALYTGFPILTYNKKDFDFIDDLAFFDLA